MFYKFIEISYWILTPQFVNKIQSCKGVSLVCKQFNTCLFKFAVSPSTNVTGHIWFSVTLFCNTLTTQPLSQIFMKFDKVLPFMEERRVMLHFRPGSVAVLHLFIFKLSIRCAILWYNLVLVKGADLKFLRIWSLNLLCTQLCCNIWPGL